MSTFDPHEDLYAVLQVPADASDELIREQYRKLVQQYLWNREMFARLNHAFEVLSDPQSRADYDKQAAIARPRPDLSTLAAPETPAIAETAPTIVGASLQEMQATQQLSGIQRTQMSLRVTCPVCKTETSAAEGFCEECGFALEGAEGVQELPPLETPELPMLVDEVGKVFTLRPGVNTVGRLNADVLLADPSVSRSHARIIVQDNLVSVEDIGSTNGTLVNGQRLAPQVAQVVISGAKITFGGVTLTLQMPMGASSDVTAEPTEVPKTDAEPTPVQVETATPSVESAEVIAYWCSEDGILRVPLSKGVYTIGRRPSNQIVLTDPYVSGSHAVLCVEPEGMTIEDVGSTNGTFVDETKLLPNVPAPLPYGVKVQIGQGSFYLEPATHSEDEPEDETEVPEQPEVQGNAE